MKVFPAASSSACLPFRGHLIRPDPVLLTRRVDLLHGGCGCPTGPDDRPVEEAHVKGRTTSQGNPTRRMRRATSEIRPVLRDARCRGHGDPMLSIGPTRT